MPNGLRVGPLRVLDGVTALMASLAVLALAGIVAAYVFEVVARYIFAAPTWWSAELVSYLLCVLTFCMLPRVTQTRGQVAVTILLEQLGAPARAGVERAIWLLGFAASAAMAWFAGGETARQIVRGVAMMAAYPIPKWWVSIWIGLGFGLTALQFLRLALDRSPPPAAAAAPEL